VGSLDNPPARSVLRIAPLGLYLFAPLPHMGNVTPLPHHLFGWFSSIPLIGAQMLSMIPWSANDCGCQRGLQKLYIMLMRPAYD
jgi:hypothetical protein